MEQLPLLKRGKKRMRNGGEKAMRSMTSRRLKRRHPQSHHRTRDVLAFRCGFSFVLSKWSGEDRFLTHNRIPQNSA